MNLTRNVCVVASLLALTACSSAPKGQTDLPSQKEVVSDFVVRERYPENIPDWAKDFATWRNNLKGVGQNYFLGESGFVSERTSGCELSDLQAKRKIAQQIAVLITNKIGTTQEGQLIINPLNADDPGMRKHFEDTIAAKSIAFLSGVKVQGTYWETRDYSQSGGKKDVYLCSTLVSIDDLELKNAIRRTGQKATDVVEDPEAKAVVKEALKDVDKSFDSYISRLSN